MQIFFEAIFAYEGKENYKFFDGGRVKKRV